MPYLPIEEKRKYQPRNVSAFTHPGQLNYSITELIIMYMKDRGLSYHTINDILGALEGAKIEFYNRIAKDYEATKIEQNGDVY